MRYLIHLAVLLLLALMVLPAAGQDVPCTVSTPKHNTVRLRETPATNGAVAGFMPANTQFNVTGKFLGTRNAVWFRLVKDEVAPTSAAAEIWVGAVAVNASGNCDAVAVLNPAPAAPAAPAADPNAAPPANPAAVLPRAGRWQFTVVPSVTYSCADGFSFTLALTEDEVTDLNGLSRVRTSRGTFTVDGYPMNINPDGTYTGVILTFTQEFEGNGAVVLKIESDIRMTGMIVITATENGLTCAGTIPIVLDWVRR